MRSARSRTRGPRTGSCGRFRYEGLHFSLRHPGRAGKDRLCKKPSRGGLMAAVSSIILEDAASIADELGDRLQALAGSRLLVTGGAGFLCSHLLDAVAALN